MNNTVRLVGGLPKNELVEKLLFHHRQGEIAERALGFYLLDMQRRREFRPGFQSAACWAAEKLGIEQADRLVLTAERIENLPAIDHAFASGDVSWTKVREIVRVATLKTEAEWLELARTKTSREIEAAVARSRRGDRPKGGLGTPRPHSVVRILVSQEGKTLWDTTSRKVRDQLGGDATPSDAFHKVCEMVLGMDTGEGAPERTESSRSAYTVVFHSGADGKSFWMDAGDGRLEVSKEAVEEKLRAGARRIEVRDIEGAGDCPAARFGERGSVEQDERDAAVSPKMRDAVLARDGHRCLVCGATRHITVHHLDSLADGGKTVMERLAALCRACHGEVHEQEMLLRVEEDGSLSALDADGNPLAGRQPAAGAVEMVETVLAASAAPLEETCETPSFLSLEDIPREMSSGDWRDLESQVEWSPQNGAFLFRPRVEILPGREARRTEPAERAPRGPATRPLCFADFVGQRRAVANILLAARAADARGEVPGHVLLSGPPGLGKTTLARLLAHQRGVGIEEVVAGQIADPHQLVSILTRLEKGDVLFVDEIHALKGTCEEALYSALEDGTVDIAVCERGRTRMLRLHLEPFTLIGATTRLGALSEPFRARFPIQQRLEPYTESELAEVVARGAERLGASASPEAALEISRRARGTPREALRLLAWARDLAQVGGAPKMAGKSDHVVGLDHVVRISEQLGIDARGLQKEEQAVVRLLLERAAPVGLEAIASKLSLDLDTLRHVHEPFLERAGLVERTERGRVATARARATYGEQVSRIPVIPVVSRGSRGIPILPFPLGSRGA